MISVLILEDETYTRRFLVQLVYQSPLIDKVIDTPSGVEAVRLAKEYRPEIALLDIELEKEEKMDGIKTAKMINSINPETYLRLQTTLLS